MSTQTELPPPLQSLNTNELRQRLACLIDPAEAVTVTDKEYFRLTSIEFCSVLPIVFGESLDRMTMWDRIAGAIQAGYAKTVSGDMDLFCQCVFEHVKAGPMRVAANYRVCDVVAKLSDMSGERGQQLLTYLVTHLIPVLVFARRERKDSIGGAK